MRYRERLPKLRAMSWFVDLLGNDSVSVDMEAKHIEAYEQQRRLAVRAYIKFRRRTGPGAPEIAGGNSRPAPFPRHNYTLKPQEHLSRMPVNAGIDVGANEGFVLHQ